MTTSPPEAPHAAPRPFLTTGRLVTLVVVVLLLGGFGFVWARSMLGDGSSGVVQTGSRAPDFALPGLDGGQVRLSDYHGQVVLVNFWATWCQPCKVEMPEIQAVHQARSVAGFTVIGVDQGESADQVRSYVTQGGYNWTFALDQSGGVSRTYAVYGIPQSYLIDRDGKVAYMWFGPLTRDSLEHQLARLGIGG